MNLIEVMKQALEALELVIYPQQRQKNAITNLRAAIEEAEKQEPVAEHDLKDVRCEYCGYMTYHREHMGCIRAAAPTIPEGWQLVPKEPTEEMKDIGNITVTLNGNGRAVWKAMLAVAPKP